MTDIDRGAKTAQAQVFDAVCRDVVDGRVHQLSAPVPARAGRGLALGM